MNNIFLQRILKYLIENTKMGRYEKLPDIDFHYDGYIIVPIGSGFRFDVYNKSRQPDGDFTMEWWGEMKDVYSLKNEEVIPLLDEYNNFLWELVEEINSEEDIKGEINESKKVNKKISLSPNETEFMYDAYKVMGLDKEWAIYDLKSLLEWLNGLPDTITLYRLLYIDEDKEINKEELGDHYSTDKKELLYNHHNKGSIYGGHWGDPVLLTVKIKKEQIDIFNTLHNNIMYPHEQEITLKDKGKGSQLIDVTTI